jgi:hypothetical protein
VLFETHPTRKLFEPYEFTVTRGKHRETLEAELKLA